MGEFILRPRRIAGKLPQYSSKTSVILLSHESQVPFLLMYLKRLLLWDWGDSVKGSQTAAVTSLDARGNGVSKAHTSGLTAVETQGVRLECLGRKGEKHKAFRPFGSQGIARRDVASEGP